MTVSEGGILARSQRGPRPREELRADMDVVMAAVSDCGMALECASPACRANADAVLTAVGRGGRALEFAAEPLRGDPRVVLRAVAQDPIALRFATDALRADPEVVLAAVRPGVGGGALALEDAHPDLLGDPRFIARAVRLHPEAIRHASTSLRMDRGFLARALGGEIFEDAKACHALEGTLDREDSVAEDDDAQHAGDG